MSIENRRRLNSNCVKSRCDINEFIEDLLERDNEFTGSVEINFKDGRAVDSVVRRRIKF